MILNLLFYLCRWKVEEGGVEVVYGAMVDRHLFFISRPSTCEGSRIPRAKTEDDDCT